MESEEVCRKLGCNESVECFGEDCITTAFLKGKLKSKKLKVKWGGYAPRWEYDVSEEAKREIDEKINEMREVIEYLARVAKEADEKFEFHTHHDIDIPPLKNEAFLFSKGRKYEVGLTVSLWWDKILYIQLEEHETRDILGDIIIETQEGQKNG